jgi:hypothetical protein
MKDEKTKLEPEKYQLIPWADLEHMSEIGGCKCCGQKFSKGMPMEIASKCHPGNPTWVSYWDGVLYFKCAVCESPVCRIEVSCNLLAKGMLK